ncbi:MFS transporter [Streptomyces sp. MUM 203J]|uniref:MFS transporter n=1 Tax=Streptomyces sp. MUM 203J TaxID=2791990 RepID=UPI001F04314D|nr:MFS transporter [Streptomyces sp. MUM 203J]MCH0542316.1 MFS transporter [Streptomyces sp. MUM 203J]
MKSPTSAGRGAVLPILLLASTLTVMAGAVVAPVLEVIRDDLGLSGTAAGMILTAHGLSIAIASPAVGWAIDRFGVRVPLAGGLVLYGLAGGAGAFLDSYAALIATRIAFGVGAAAVFAGTTVALLSYYQGEQRDTVMGWRSTAISLGGVVWPLLAGAVGGLSWHAPFAIYLIGVPLGLLALAALPSARPAPAPAGTVKERILPLLARRPALLGFYGLLIAASLLLYGLAVFNPFRLAEIGIDKPFHVALISTTASVTMSLVGFGYARLRAAFGYGQLLRITAVTWTLAFALLGLTGHAALIVVGNGLFGLGMGILMPAVTVLIGDTAPPALRGQATALSGTASFAGQFVSPLILGPLVDNTSITTGFLACAGLAAVLLLTLLAVRITDPEPSPQEQGEPEQAAA